ncbi:hypothetical protein JW711_00460 [Candidatus Woesearchaeota archaeon]|nr:hypothetical protein [Candidatus Woesearchaeota archaeon]
MNQTTKPSEVRDLQHACSLLFESDQNTIIRGNGWRGYNEGSMVTGVRRIALIYMKQTGYEAHYKGLAREKDGAFTKEIFYLEEAKAESPAEPLKPRREYETEISLDKIVKEIQRNGIRLSPPNPPIPRE